MNEDEEPVEDSQDVMNDFWFKRNYIDLIHDHPNEWIAVLDQKIISSGGMKRQVEKEAQKIAGDREFSMYFIEPSDIMP